MSGHTVSLYLIELMDTFPSLMRPTLKIRPLVFSPRVTGAKLIFALALSSLGE